MVKTQLVKEYIVNANNYLSFKIHLINYVLSLNSGFMIIEDG